MACADDCHYTGDFGVLELGMVLHVHRLEVCTSGFLGRISEYGL
jgi:hypothetical protein